MDVLQNKRAGYGEEIVSTLSAQLTAEYGRGFGRRNLFRMMQSAEYFPDEQIVSALSAQLSRSTRRPRFVGKLSGLRRTDTRIGKRRAESPCRMGDQVF
jgi:hypothetical protein